MDQRGAQGRRPLNERATTIHTCVPVKPKTLNVQAFMSTAEQPPPDSRALDDIHTQDLTAGHHHSQLALMNYSLFYIKNKVSNLYQNIRGAFTHQGKITQVSTTL